MIRKFYGPLVAAGLAAASFGAARTAQASPVLTAAQTQALTACQEKAAVSPSFLAEINREMAQQKTPGASTGGVPAELSQELELGNLLADQLNDQLKRACARKLGLSLP